ncbi:MAG: hypothetical protein K6F50_01555 [Kiritimatiellae bacterium]|nr:hypothetical protein [Kiritimatiellia bacterium]
MPLDVNGYNDTFRAFVDFAQTKVDAGHRKAIADVSYLAGKEGVLGGLAVQTSTTDSVGGIFSRTARHVEINDTTRKLFFNAVVDMFGREEDIPGAVRNALKLKDYGVGKPLTARRIMAVKNAIDLSGVAMRRAADAKLGTFQSGEVRAAAAKMGYTQIELPRIARAAHFYAEAKGCSEMDAMKAVADPGSAANRLMGYGGRFLENASNFAEGLRLIDSFKTWYEDLSGTLAMNQHHDDQTLAKADTLSKLNMSSNVLTAKAGRGMEKFVFEELASNPGMDLTETDPEKLFGFGNNAASRYVGRGFANSTLYTLKEIPPAKRQLLFKVFDLFCKLPKDAAEFKEATKPMSGAVISGGNRPTVIARVLRHFEALEALEAKGRLTAENVLKTIFPDMTKAQRGANDSKAINAFLDGCSAAISLDEDEGGKYSDVSRGMWLFMERTGTTLDEAADAMRTGKTIASPRWLVDASTELQELDGTPAGSRKIMDGDLYRPSNYADTFTHQKDILPSDGGFGFRFPGVPDRIQTGPTAEGRANVERVGDEVEKLCGKVHPQQASTVMLMLSQSGMSYLRDGLPEIGLHSNEHSVVDYTLTRDERTGAVTIHYDSPEGLPARFSWSATVGVDGSVTKTPIVAERPVDFDAEKSAKAAGEAAKALGVKLDAAQTQKAAELIQTHGNGMYTRNARLLAKFVVSLVHAGMKNPEGQTAAFAPQLKHWRNVHFGDPSMRQVDDAFTEMHQDAIRHFLSNEGNFGGANNEADIHRTMLDDAHRAQYVFNGHKINREGPSAQTHDEVISTFRKTVPPKAYRMISSLMHQASYSPFVYHGMNSSMQLHNPPKSILMSGLPGGSRLAHRDFAAGMGANARDPTILMGTSMTYALDVAEDGKSAVLTVTGDSKLSADKKVGAALVFGSIRQVQKMHIDLSGEEPKLERVEVSQTLGD